MSSTNYGADRTTKRIRWIARIWAIVLVVIALVIFAGNVWSWVSGAESDPNVAEDYPPIENLPPIFYFLSIVGLALAWRWEGLGGAIAILFSLASLPVLLIHWPIAHEFPSYLFAPYGVWLMIVIPGVLFLICWWRSRGRVGS
jgi:hypothetical protein